MSSYLNLTKVFIKSLSMSKIKDKKQRFIFKTLLFLTFFFIFIPFTLVVGVSTMQMTMQLGDVGFETIGINLVVAILCLFIFVFSLPVIINELYFNDNIEYILPLPLRPSQMTMSKFTACYLAENVMSFFIVAIGGLGYLFGLITLKAHINTLNYILLVIGSFFLPLVPMIYCGILSLIIMNFTKFIKNKETIRQISMITVFIVLFLFAGSISFLEQFNFDKYLESLALGNHTFINVMNIVFPQIKLFIDFIATGNLLKFLLFIIVNIIYLLVFIYLSNLLYVDGVINLSSKNTTTNKNSTKLLDKIKENTPFKAYMIKEFKVLMRTPSYFINCMIVNIIWPIFVYVIYKVNKFDLEEIKTLLSSNDHKSVVILLIYIVAISILVPAVNSIASSSFSREGKHFSFMKYIPVHYYIQWMSKVLIAFIVSFIGINIFTTIFYIYMHVNILNVLLLYLISFTIVLFISCLSTYIDSIQPKLIWDDELNALRENYNTFMVMGISLLYGTVLCFISYKLYLQNINILLIYAIILLIALVSLLFSIILTKKSGIKNIIIQEET